MNNLRFINSGKRKQRASFSIGNTGQSVTWGDVKAALTGVAVNVRLSHITIELTPTSDVGRAYEREINILGRPASIIASNSIGPDGTYKVPETHILANYTSVSDTGLDSYIIIQDPTGSENEGFNVNVWLDTVA